MVSVYADGDDAGLAACYRLCTQLGRGGRVSKLFKRKHDGRDAADALHDEIARLERTLHEDAAAPAAAWAAWRRANALPCGKHPEDLGGPHRAAARRRVRSDARGAGPTGRPLRVASRFLHTGGLAALRGPRVSRSAAGQRRGRGMMSTASRCRPRPNPSIPPVATTTCAGAGPRSGACAASAPAPSGCASSAASSPSASGGASTPTCARLAGMGLEPCRLTTAAGCSQRLPRPPPADGARIARARGQPSAPACASHTSSGRSGGLARTTQ